MPEQRPDTSSSPDSAAASQPNFEHPAPDATSADAAELEATRDRLLRAQAELENARRRFQRELQDARKYANQPLLTDLLPVLDNMERAIAAAEQTSDGAGLLEGFKMVHQMLLSVLERHDCVPVEAQGSTFDPAHHEAIMQEPSSAAKGTVTRVIQPGYLLHDRVIRPAQVFVSAGSADDESDAHTNE